VYFRSACDPDKEKLRGRQEKSSSMLRPRMSITGGEVEPKKGIQGKGERCLRNKIRHADYSKHTGAKGKSQGWPAWGDPLFIKKGRKPLGQTNFKGEKYAM